jgi:hypothetical protein
MSQPLAESPELLCERSLVLRKKACALLEKAGALCQQSKRLRQATAFNPNPNARRNIRKRIYSPLFQLPSPPATSPRPLRINVVYSLILKPAKAN